MTHDAEQHFEKPLFELKSCPRSDRMLATLFSKKGYRSYIYIHIYIYMHDLVISQTF